MSNHEIVIDNIVLVPSVGDYVHLLNESDGEQGMFRVRSRHFTYGHHYDEWTMYANVVVEEGGDKWGQLIKE